MALFAQAMCNPAQVAQLWAASMAAQTMVQQQGEGQSIQQQGGRQTARLAGSKTGRHEPAAGAPDEVPKSPDRRGKKKYSMVISVLLVPFPSAQRQAALANFNTLQAPRGVKVLESVIVEFNKRFGDGMSVTKFREGPGRQPQGYTKVSSILF